MTKTALTTRTGNAIAARDASPMRLDKSKLGGIAEQLGLNKDIVGRMRLALTTELQLAKACVKGVTNYLGNLDLAKRHKGKAPDLDQLMISPVKIEVVTYRKGKKELIKRDVSSEVRHLQAVLYNEIRLKTGDAFVKNGDGDNGPGFKVYVPLINADKNPARKVIDEVFARMHEADPSGVPLRVQVEYIGVDIKSVKDEDLAEAAAEEAAPAPAAS